MHLNYNRYLEAKRTVDDRALNKGVYEKFKQLLSGNGPRLEILEIGAGTAAMLRRFLAPENTDFPPNVTAVEYTLLDIKPEVLTAAKDLLLGNPPQFTGASASMKHENRGIDVAEEIDIGSIKLEKGGKLIQVNFVLQDAQSYLSRSLPGFDAVVTCSFLDLLDDIEEFLNLISKSLTSIRAVYFALNFSGITKFTPQFIPQSGIDAFHANMGTFKPGNHPRASSGAHLRRLIEQPGYKVVAEGASDWKVAPPYVADEAYFLECILDFINVSTSGNGEAVQKGMEVIAQEKLSYFASNIDICASL